MASSMQFLSSGLGKYNEKELPSLLPKQEALSEVSKVESHFGPVPDIFRQGFSNVQNDLSCSHPLEYSEKNYFHVQNKRDMMMLRSIQGLHAPLKLQLERTLASQKRRLPCLPSSMVALETLVGMDTTIGFDDFLNDPCDGETPRDVHSLMENRK
ncbi:proteasome maturation protein-like [Xenia sp. Carnegie-2017]|uniref:proteasome maturation protein-like n=1 Tax=Xenia sp. Carnegie-2017 TaxID=2897299 RepID=UPI001F03B303|nr:proteasome maturation protein-like [Xenia sp. Carnegie-2017]